MATGRLTRVIEHLRGAAGKQLAAATGDDDLVRRYVKDGDATAVYSFALNYYFASFTKFQVQYDFKKELGSGVIQKKNDLFSLQAQVFF